MARAAREMVADPMKRDRGISYAGAASGIAGAAIQGVAIPLASAVLMWRLKQAPRAQGEIDRVFALELRGTPGRR